MKFCPYCGAQNENGFAFCPSCGKSLAAEHAAAAAGQKDSDRGVVPENYRPAWKDAAQPIQRPQPKYLNVQELRPAWEEDPDVFLKKFYGPNYSAEPSVSSSAVPADFSSSVPSSAAAAGTAPSRGQTESAPAPEGVRYTVRERDSSLSGTGSGDHIRSDYDSRYTGQSGAQTVYIASDSRSAADPDDSGGFLWWLIGFLFPAAGLVLYLNYKKRKPLRAHSASVGALVMMILIILIAIFLFAGVFLGIVGFV